MFSLLYWPLFFLSFWIYFKDCYLLAFKEFIKTSFYSIIVSYSFIFRWRAWVSYCRTLYLSVNTLIVSFRRDYSFIVSVSSPDSLLMELLLDFSFCEASSAQFYTFSMAILNLCSYYLAIYALSFLSFWITLLYYFNFYSICVSFVFFSRISS